MNPAWYPALFATGLVAGFVDAMAGGGGLLTVPMLMASGLPPQVVLGTNKFQSSCGTALATWQYAQHGLLDWKTVRTGIFATLTSSLAGAWAVSQIEPSFLRPLIPGLLLVIALYTAFKPDLGQKPRPALLSHTIFGIVIGLILGFYDGFFGPGTGSFWTVACVLLLGLSLLPATAYTKVMNLTSNLASLAVFLFQGKVRFDVGLTMAAGQLIGGQLGARMAVQGGHRVIRPVFLTMVVILTLKLGRDAWLQGAVP